MVECFNSERVLGIADMAVRLPLSRATTHRYAATLTALGWLEQNQERKYRLAQHCLVPGTAVLGEIMLGTRAEPVLRELREQTGYTVSLGVLDGLRATYVCRLPGRRGGQFEADGELRAGAHVPLHCTALGKALLASLPDEELQALLASLELTRYAQRTITTKKRLRNEVERVRADGVATSELEFSGAECAVAVVVPRLFRERRLAVEVSAPVAEMSLMALCKSVAGRLGGALERMRDDS